MFSIVVSVFLSVLGLDAPEFSGTYRTDRGWRGEGIDRLMFFDYTPTQDALEINRQRIKERNQK